MGRVENLSAAISFSKRLVCHGTKEGSESHCSLLSRVWEPLGGHPSPLWPPSLDALHTPSNWLDVAGVYCWPSRGVSPFLLS